MPHLDPETVETWAPVATPVVSTLIQHQLNLRHTRKQAEFQKEIEEKRAEQQQSAFEGVERTQVNHPPEEPDADAGGSEGNAVMDLMEKESCSMCKTVLREIDDLSGTEREKALAEYGQLKQVMGQADDKGDVKEFVSSTEVLEDVIESIV